MDTGVVFLICGAVMFTTFVSIAIGAFAYSAAKKG